MLEGSSKHSDHETRGDIKDDKLCRPTRRTLPSASVWRTSRSSWMTRALSLWPGSTTKIHWWVSYSGMKWITCASYFKVKLALAPVFLHLPLVKTHLLEIEADLPENETVMLEILTASLLSCPKFENIQYGPIN